MFSVHRKKLHMIDITFDTLIHQTTRVSLFVKLGSVELKEQQKIVLPGKEQKKRYLQ